MKSNNLSVFFCAVASYGLAVGVLLHGTANAMHVFTPIALAGEVAPTASGAFSTGFDLPSADCLGTVSFLGVLHVNPVPQPMSLALLKLGGLLVARRWHASCIHGS